MTTGATSLLGLALPVQGELSGTWGDVVNDSITSLVDSAVAGTTTLSSDTDVTLTTTTLAANQARQAIILWTATGTTTRNITAPASSKQYVVINATGGTQSIVVRGVGPTTGVTILAGEKAVVAWNGSDFVKVSGSVSSVSWTGGLVSVATPTTTPAFTVAGTSGGIPYFSSGSTWASSAALAANALVIGGGAGAAPATTTTGTGVVTAVGNAVNTAGGLVTQSGTLAASALLLGGGSGTAVSSTTTGTGVVTALGNNANATGGFTTIDGAATLTNKRIDPRVSSTTSASSVTPTVASYDIYAFTALAATLTINAPTGTPVDGDKLIFRILDNGTSQTLSWNGTYTAIGVTLPTATAVNKMTYVGCIYNAANTRWDVIAVTTQA